MAGARRARACAVAPSAHCFFLFCFSLCSWRRFVAPQNGSSRWLSHTAVRGVSPVTVLSPTETTERSSFCIWRDSFPSNETTGPKERWPLAQVGWERGPVSSSDWSPVSRRGGSYAPTGAKVLLVSAAWKPKIWIPSVSNYASVRLL